MKMRVLVAFVTVALVVVSAKPTEDDAAAISEELDSYLTGLSEKRSLASRGVMCGPDEDTPCCQVKSCPHGECNDQQGDNLAHLYGYICEGDMCGTRAGQFTGIDCDVPTETACDYCKRFDRFTDEKMCFKTRSTFEGVFCYSVNPDNTVDLLNQRVVDLAFGMGTSEELSRIVKEHAEKRELSGLVARLLKELE